MIVVGSIDVVNTKHLVDGESNYNICTLGMEEYVVPHDYQGQVHHNSIRSQSEDHKCCI